MENIDGSYCNILEIIKLINLNNCKIIHKNITVHLNHSDNLNINLDF